MLSGGGDFAGIASTLGRQCDRYVLVYEALFDHAFEMACVDGTTALLAHDLDVVAEPYVARLLAVAPA